MAWMNQEKKAKIKVVLDPIMKEYGLKYSLSVNNHSTIVCTVKSGTIDFIDNHNQVTGSGAGIGNRYLDINPYWYQDHFTGVAKEAIGKILGALNTDNHDNSDIQTDYFDVGHYVDLNIGAWDRPYVLHTLGGMSLGDYRDSKESV